MLCFPADISQTSVITVYHCNCATYLRSVRFWRGTCKRERGVYFRRSATQFPLHCVGSNLAAVRRHANCCRWVAWRSRDHVTPGCSSVLLSVCLSVCVCVSAGGRWRWRQVQNAFEICSQRTTTDVPTPPAPARARLNGRRRQRIMELMHADAGGKVLHSAPLAVCGAWSPHCRSSPGIRHRCSTFLNPL